MSLFNSMYEVFNALTTVAKQHFRHDFTGKQLSNIWTQNNINGTGSVSMNDAVDGGVGFASGSNLNNESSWSCNDKRQFIHNSSVIIIVAQRNEDSHNYAQFGFNSDKTWASGQNMAIVYHRADTANISLQTKSGSGSTTQSSGIARDTNWHVYKIENLSGSTNLYIDGVLKVTNTTNLPVIGLQPVFDIGNDFATSVKLNVRSVEAYNV